MATAHSKTGRAKSPSPEILIPSWDKVWESFKDSRKRITIESMNADGWKTLEQASADSGMGRTTIRNLAADGKLEKASGKVDHMGATRYMTFYRPVPS